MAENKQAWQDVLNQLFNMKSAPTGGTTAPPSSLNEDKRGSVPMDVRNPQTPPQKATEAPQRAQKELEKLQDQADRQKEKLDKGEEVYRIYQANIKASQELQAEILQGLKEGEGIYRLFLKAALAITCMTGNDLFYDQASGLVVDIYSASVLDSEPLMIAYESAQKRLNKLKNAQKEQMPEDNRQRIRAAIEAHEAMIRALADQIREAEDNRQ